MLVSKNLDTIKEAWEYQFTSADPGRYGPQPNFRGVPTLKPAFVTTVEALEAYYTDDDSPGGGQQAWNDDFGANAPFDRCVGYFDDAPLGYCFYVVKGKIVKRYKQRPTVTYTDLNLSLPIAFKWSYPNSYENASSILFFDEISAQNFMTPIKITRIDCGSVSALYNTSILIIPDDNNELEVYTFDYKSTPDWDQGAVTATTTWQAGQFFGDSLIVKNDPNPYKAWKHSTPATYLIVAKGTSTSAETPSKDIVAYATSAGTQWTADGAIVSYFPIEGGAVAPDVGWVYWLGGDKANTITRLSTGRSLKVSTNALIFRLA